MTVQSEWLTTLGEDDLLQFSHVAKPFENLAVVVVGRKVYAFVGIPTDCRKPSCNSLHAEAIWLTG